ncbi:MAG: 5-formyltetrahydrofolate cyclo-ligase [Elusimicrobiota bacterium]
MKNRSVLIFQKKKIRLKIKKVLQAMSRDLRKSKSSKITDYVIKLNDFNHAKNVMIFYPLKTEVDTKKIIKLSLKRQKRVLLPRVIRTKKSKKIIPQEVKDLKKDITRGTYGIMEPAPVKRVFPYNKIDLVFVPGVAFDKQGYRLGHGAGYYDSFLKKIPGFKTIALAYSEQLIKMTPREKHDLPVSRIITEKGEIKCQKQ